MVVTFNRSLTSSEQSAFSASMMAVADESDEDETEFTLSGGFVSRVSGSVLAGAGTYSISGNTLTIRMTTEWIFTGFELDS